jgi:hypothetical protein
MPALDVSYYQHETPVVMEEGISRSCRGTSDADVPDSTARYAVGNIPRINGLACEGGITVAGDLQSKVASRYCG